MMLRFLTAGNCRLVDYGRPRSRNLGVPVGGAADCWSLALGNALVGNSPGTPAIEITLAGPNVVSTTSLAGVVYGAPFAMTRDDAGPLAPGVTFTLPADVPIRIRSTRVGLRAYLCVSGGVHAPKVLGSESSLTPIPKDAEFDCQSGSIAARFIRPECRWNRDPLALRAIDGPQREWFRESHFFGKPLRVSPASDRMGLRLEGEALSVPNRELLSEPVAPGAVQVTRDGQCIILGVDGQTIGGYPKIAHVIGAELDKVGQLRPHDVIRFQSVSLDEAEAIERDKRAELNDWLTRLLPGL